MRSRRAWSRCCADAATSSTASRARSTWPPDHTQDGRLCDRGGCPSCSGWYDALLAEQDAGVCACHVLVDEDGAVFGRFNLVDLQDHSADVGYRVAEHVTGRGVATYAVLEVCRLAAARHGLRTLRAATASTNAASQRVLTKAGFVPVGPADPAHLGGKPGIWYQRDLGHPDDRPSVQTAPIAPVDDDEGRLTVVELIARGRDADVFALDGGRVLRRYRAGGDTAREAAIMRHVAGHGYPVPRVHESRGADLVLQRIHGPTLLAALVSGEVTVRAGAGLLADLLDRLHAVPPRPGARAGVVHLDLHPDNVLLGPAGPVVIDWRNAADGPPELDLAVTALILALVATDPEDPLAGPAHQLLSAFARVAHGDLRAGLPGAVELRRVDPALSPLEKGGLEAATVLVHAATTG